MYSKFSFFTTFHLTKFQIKSSWAGGFGQGKDWMRIYPFILALNGNSDINFSSTL